MRVKERTHWLRSTRIVHTCKVLGKTFTLREWLRYTAEHIDTIHEVVAVCDGYEYTVNDVCVNPTVIEWSAGERCGDFFRIELCRIRNGRWTFGRSYSALQSASYWGAVYPADDERGYISKEEAVSACLCELRDNLDRIREYVKRTAVEYDEEGNAHDTSKYRMSRLKKMYRAIEEYRGRYGVRQLTIFDVGA